MRDERRRFFRTSGACLLGAAGLASTAEAASATRSRLYVSHYPIRRIARDLVYGIGYQVVQHVKQLPPERVENFIARLSEGQFAAQLGTLRQDIDIVLDNITVAVGYLPQPERVREYLGAIAAVALEDEDWQVDNAELEKLRDLYLNARSHVLNIVASSSLTISYRLRYKNACFGVMTHAQQGHFRLEVRLLHPVGIHNTALFVADLQQRNGCTYVNTSLYNDVCTGRREGPLVRRIADRIIGERQCYFLAEIEREVFKVVHRDPTSRLNRMIPELIRRLGNGES